MTLNPEHAPKGCRAIRGTGSALDDCLKCCFGPREKCRGPSRFRPCIPRLRRDKTAVYFTAIPEEATVPKITFTPAPQAAKTPRTLYIHLWVDDQNNVSMIWGTTELDGDGIAKNTEPGETYIGVLKVPR